MERIYWFWEVKSKGKKLYLVIALV